jgi:putative tricarboxylic transport membrane protein
MQFIVIPGIVATFSVVIIWASLQLDLSPDMIVGDSLQPRVFPIFLMLLNLLLAALLAIKYYRTPPREARRESPHTWGTIALFPLFYLLTTYVDILIAVAVVLFLMALLWGERRILVAALIALATPLFIFFLFDLALGIRFPRGLITNWYYG